MVQSRPAFVGLLGGMAIAAIAIAFVITSILNVPDYRVEVDALKVQELVSISNVRITNTGKLPLTELTVNMGEGDIQSFKKLDPGQTIWVSPKAQNLQSVTVTSNEGIRVIKDFREPMGMVAFGPG